MSNSAMQGLTCSNPDCRIAETGKCVEGFEIEECPHQKAVTSAAEELDIKATDGEPVIEMQRSEVQIDSGEILTIEEATDVLRRRPNRVVTIIGPIKSGKTTLGISLYSAFQEGPFGSWSFAGSLTLSSFEERCHPSRAGCGMTSPDTLHTSMDVGLGFLHLAIHSTDTGRLDLLISDRSGEFYSRVANSQEDCDNLHEVPRADLLLFLVDGEKLATNERHVVKSDVTMIVQTLVEGGLISELHRIGIVLTKYDQVLSSSATERTERDFNTLVEDLRKRFGLTHAEIKAFRIAARPTNKKVEPRFGILEILEECMRPRRQNKFIPSTQTAAPLDRWYFRLQIAHGGAN